MPARGFGPTISPWEVRLIPSPIRKVLFLIRKSRVQALLMGGQACVLYGGAEFSRDTDLAVLADAGNLGNLQRALDELAALPIAVPPFEQRFLELGLAVPFRCQHADCAGMRIDVMSKMRGVAPFGDLWARRTTLETEEGAIEMLSLPDLVQSKKTQCEKDWPMIARLVEASYFEPRPDRSSELIQFWLRELRTAKLLIRVTSDYRTEAEHLKTERPLLEIALQSPADEASLRAALKQEEEHEREADRQYWQPLCAELERLRRETRKQR